MKVYSGLQKRKRAEISGKKGVSALVATVLLVLIAVAAVGIIWGMLMPMLQEKIAEASRACINANIRIDAERGYTCYDAASKNLSIMVSRGADELDIAGIQVIVFAAGNSYRFDVEDNIPSANSASVFVLEVEAVPEYATVAPVMQIGKSKKTCGIASRADINLCG